MMTFYVTFCWRSQYKRSVFKVTARDVDTAYALVFNKFGNDFHSIIDEQKFMNTKFSRYKVIGEIFEHR